MFEYKLTCALIDEGRDQLKNAIDDLIDDLCPLLSNSVTQEQKKEIIESIYNSYFDHLVEELRQTNIDMRAAAEDQIKELESYIDDLEAINSWLEDSCECN